MEEKIEVRFIKDFEVPIEQRQKKGLWEGAKEKVTYRKNERRDDLTDEQINHLGAMGVIKLAKQPSLSRLTQCLRASTHTRIRIA